MIVCCSQGRLVCSIEILGMIALTPGWMGAFLIAVTYVLPDGHRTYSSRRSTRQARRGGCRRKVPLTKNIEQRSQRHNGKHRPKIGVLVLAMMVIIASLTKFGIPVPF